MLNLCCLKSLFRLSFCIPGQPLPLPPMIESKASYGAILLHQYISLWDVLPALLQVVTPLLMHPRPNRHHLLGAKGNLCSAFLSHEDEVGEFFFLAKDMQRQQIFLSRLFHCYFCSLGIAVLQVLGSFFWYFGVAFLGSGGNLGWGRAREALSCGSVGYLLPLHGLSA